ncbi:MAG: class I SAM-dependent methyltransferase [Desulfomonilaceae bacterium]
MEALYRNFIRYLDAKRTVDDRALNKDVWGVFKREFTARHEQNAMPRLVELGAGIGVMFERCVEWGLLGSCSYTAIDSMADNMAEAERRLPKWCSIQGFSLETLGSGRFLLRRGDAEIHLRLQTIDVFEFAALEEQFHAWDVVIANAFLDLLDLPSSLPKLFKLLKPEGLFYFTINFDGGTTFQPTLDASLDEVVERLYHRTMDERITDGKPSGDSQTGRRLFGHLTRVGATLLAAGSSDWVVFPGEHGYVADEAYFLHFIIDTIGAALQGRPELNMTEFEEWVRARHEQIDEKSLIYIAHQLDFVGKGPSQTAD